MNHRVLITPIALACLSLSARAQSTRRVVPEHAPAAAGVPTLLAAPSIVNAELVLPLGPLRDEAAHAVPTPLATFYAGTQFCCPLIPEHGGTVTGGALSLTGNGTSLVWSLPAHLHAWVVAAGDCEADMTIRIETTPSVSADWALTTTSHRLPTVWAPECRLFFGSTPITSTIDPIANGHIDAVAARVDASVGRVEMRRAVEAFWARLHEVREATGSMWAHAAPSALWLRTLATDGTNIRASIGAIGTVALEQRRRTVVPLPVPANVAPTFVPLGTHVLIRLGFNAVDTWVRLALMRIGIHDGGVDVETRVLGANRLAVGLRLPHLYDGRIWLAATVSFDPARAAVNIGPLEILRPALLGPLRRVLAGVNGRSIEIPVAGEVAAMAAALTHQSDDGRTRIQWTTSCSGVENVGLDVEGFGVVATCDMNVRVTIH